MKKLILISFILISLSGLTWVVSRDFSDSFGEVKPTQIQFEQTEIDIGQLQQGKPKTVHFAFKNTGEHPLVIQQVEASCGCTEPQWPKNPIKPSQSGEIKVTYDAKYPGRFVKSIKVFCNSEKGMEELVVKGDVD